MALIEVIKTLLIIIALCINFAIIALWLYQEHKKIDARNRAASEQKRRQQKNNYQ